MKTASSKLSIKEKRKRRVSNSLKQKNSKNRLRILFQVSSKHLYAQVIDDEAGKTLASVSTLETAFAGNTSRKNKEVAIKLAEKLAEKVTEKNISSEYVFDRGAKLYHGKVKVFAEKLKEKGLKF